MHQIIGVAPLPRTRGKAQLTCRKAAAPFSVVPRRQASPADDLGASSIDRTNDSRLSPEGQAPSGTLMLNGRQISQYVTDDPAG